MAQWPGGGRDPHSYPPRQEGTKPGHSLPQLLWSPVLNTPSPAGVQWPPTHILCPVSECPAIVGTSKEPHGAQPACRGLRTRGALPRLPLLHTELTRGLGLRQAGPLASTTLSPVSGAQGGRMSAFSRKQGYSLGLLERVLGSQPALDGLAM